jgi:hypothetical protein
VILDGERNRLLLMDKPANLVRLDKAIASSRTAPQVGVVVVVVVGRGELTLDGQVHQLAPMVIAHLPKGTFRGVEVVNGPLAYLSVHRRRPAGLRSVGSQQASDQPRLHGAWPLDPRGAPCQSQSGTAGGDPGHREPAASLVTKCS